MCCCLALKVAQWGEEHRWKADVDVLLFVHFLAFFPWQVGPAGGLIGRSRKCTISLLHDCEVSHNHALLEIHHGHLYLRDVGSTFGTYLNDKRLSEPKRASDAHKLKPCDSIKVGQTNLRWRPLPVIRASLAVSVPASVVPLAEQCVALAERFMGGRGGLPADASLELFRSLKKEAGSTSSSTSRSATTGPTSERSNQAQSSGEAMPNRRTLSLETARSNGVHELAATPSHGEPNSSGGAPATAALEFIHRTGTDETHQRLLLVLRTLHLRVCRFSLSEHHHCSGCTHADMLMLLPRS